MVICGSMPTVRRATENDRLVRDGICKVGRLLWDCKKCREVWRIHVNNMNDPEVKKFLEEEGGE